MGKTDYQEVLYVFVQERFKPNYIKKQHKINEGVLRYTRSSPGCLGCDIYQDVENPDTFFTIEVWDSEKSWFRHIHSEYMLKYFAKMKKRRYDEHVTKKRLCCSSSRQIDFGHFSRQLSERYEDSAVEEDTSTPVDD